MKKLLSMIAISAIAIATSSIISCSGGASSSDNSLFGSLPAEYEKFQNEKDALQEKAKDIKTEADKAKLIAESQKMEEEWAVKIENTAKSLDGKPVDITDDAIVVKTPLSLTFKDFFSKKDLTPAFAVNGQAEAASEIAPDSNRNLPAYTVYIAGYDAEGNELFTSKVGTIATTQADDKTVIPAGTPVEFDVLQFSAKKCEAYQQATSLKLIIKP